MKMKFIFVGMLILLSFQTHLYASYHYTNYGNYVSKAKLKHVFNSIKQKSNVSQMALAKAFYYYEKNRYAKRLSPDYLVIADYTKLATQKRLYVIDLHTATVRSYLVAHGRNSGAKGDRVWDASNVMGSYKTPTGFFKVGNKEGITATKGYDYIAVDGLEQKNRNAKRRDIILHTAWYVGTKGRSKGCFAIKPEDRWQVFSRVKNALLYSYAGEGS